MKKAIIIGKANAGKTLFALNFSYYLGNSTVKIKTTYPHGADVMKTYPHKRSIEELTSNQPHHTQCLQSLSLQLPAGKGVKNFSIIDTSGLVEGIPAQTHLRQAMAQTLASVRDAQIILHIIDASKVKELGAVEAMGEVDYQVAQFAQMRTGYVILANKMDLLSAQEGLELIIKEFAGHQIIPISALYQQGFREVKKFVWRHI